MKEKILNKRTIFNIVDLLLLAASFISINIYNIKVVALLNGTPVTSSSSFLMQAHNDNLLIYILLLCYYVLLTISFVLSIFAKKGHRDSRIQSILSVLLLLTAFYYMVTINITKGADKELIWSKGPMIIYLVLLFAIVILTFVKRSITVSDVAKVEVVEKTEVVNQPTSADELLKFRELLDNGTITQEEFDAKKKELLGL